MSSLSLHSRCLFSSLDILSLSLLVALLCHTRKIQNTLMKKEIRLVKVSLPIFFPPLPYLLASVHRLDHCILIPFLLLFILFYLARMAENALIRKEIGKCHFSGSPLSPLPYFLAAVHKQSLHSPFLL